MLRFKFNPPSLMLCNAKNHTWFLLSTLCNAFSMLLNLTWNQSMHMLLQSM